MAERSQNLQDLFLNSVRKSKNPLTIFLINGVKLTGVVTSFDNFCVLLRRDGHSQLVYKHAISTIMPSQPVQMFDGEESGQGSLIGTSERRGRDGCAESTTHHPGTAAKGPTARRRHRAGAYRAMPRGDDDTKRAAADALA